MGNFIGIDIGTTNCKIGVCDKDYKLIHFFTFPTPCSEGENGAQVYDAQKLEQLLLVALDEVAATYTPKMIAITSMAEAGAFINVKTKKVVSPLFPWQDMESEAYMTDEDIADESLRFPSTGLHAAYKYSIYKAMAFRQKNPDMKHLKFLPAASLAAYFLTGNMVTDITLAARTYACDIYKKQYDKDFLKRKKLLPELFPDITDGYSGVWKGAKVYVAGHDHVCALVAAGVTAENGETFLSLGTTGVAMGCMKTACLTDRDFASGYAFGRHPQQEQMTWMGSIQSAGASVDWILKLLGLEYKVLYENSLAIPSEVLYFPYINGSGPPQFNSKARGAFLGLSTNTTQVEMIAAVLQGIAYEIRFILENTGSKYPEKIKAVGGCTRNLCLMQKLADITGCKIEVPKCEQSALVGAAMIKNKEYGIKPQIARCFKPSDTYKERYIGLYQEYLRLQPIILNARRDL